LLSFLFLLFWYCFVIILFLFLPFLSWFPLFLLLYLLLFLLVILFYCCFAVPVEFIIADVMLMFKLRTNFILAGKKRTKTPSAH
jgi:hypothetical protein